jgi:hypothetical protein
MTKIDDFRFYNKEFTHNEVLALFHNTGLNSEQVITNKDLPVEIFDLKKNGSINQLLINNLTVNGNTTMGNTTMGNTTMGNATMNDVRINGNVELYHDGKTSHQITFYSSVNRGSDYGYIKYDDNRDGSGENSLLTIGMQNDGDDDIALMPSGNVGVNRTDPSYKLDVNGSFRSSSINTGSINATSTSYKGGNQYIFSGGEHADIGLCCYRL